MSIDYHYQILYRGGRFLANARNDRVLGSIKGRVGDSFDESPTLPSAEQKWNVIPNVSAIRRRSEESLVKRV